MHFYIHLIFSPLWRCGPPRYMASWFLRFLNHIQQRTTDGRTPLDEWSVRRIPPDNTQHSQPTSMSLAGFEPTVSLGQRLQTATLDRAATRIDVHLTFCFWRNGPRRVTASPFMRFLDQTQRRTTVGRTPLDEWSASRTYLYLTTHNTHNRQTSIPSGGIWNHNLSRRATADQRLRPRGHPDRRSLITRPKLITSYLKKRK